MSSKPRSTPPDQSQRVRALGPNESILVQAPAGSGKTDLLTRRFLRLLGEVDDPGQIVAITFTKAAAAEMRHRILSELQNASHDPPEIKDEFAMETLARRALMRSRERGWNLIDLPAQLRISTIDSFCRELAFQQSLLSGLGGGLDIAENADQFYRNAARRTLLQLHQASSRVRDEQLQDSLEILLLWRDNNWLELEEQLIAMLAQRDRWMHTFVLERDPNWTALRERLERPFTNAVSSAIHALDLLLGRVPHACSEAMELARFACTQTNGQRHRDLAERAEFPCGPFVAPDELEDARQAYECLAGLLLTDGGQLRKSLDVRLGFPPERRAEKTRLKELIDHLREISGFESALAAIRELPPSRYSEDDWKIVRACFTLLRHAAAQLRVAFSEAGVVDFIEVAQIAQAVLSTEEGTPSDAAIAIADGIRHFLVDEFQDTSRRQHRLIASLVAAWPDTAGRTLFVVGDPMQSIYFFRDADAELFPRVQKVGLELPDGEVLPLTFVPLASNFRTVPALVDRLNSTFAEIFEEQDDSGIIFAPSRAAREQVVDDPALHLHLEFVPEMPKANSSDAETKQGKEEAAGLRDAALTAQTEQIVELIRNHRPLMELARGQHEKYRIAILGRSRTVLAPVAEALRKAAIPFRAVDLEPLAERPEVLDALALARSFFNPEDRVAWLGVLRAPWCALSLSDLHIVASIDNSRSELRTIPDLLYEKLALLSDAGRQSATRILHAFDRHTRYSGEIALGTWLRDLWLAVGGSDCVDSSGRVNLELLWKSLDALPNGSTDMMGPALHEALDRLTAQPDPDANADVGVQLMTIHKSKGLEFEVVIVPELQTRAPITSGRMLSWLERGVSTPEEGEEITEFLVAPFQSKGADCGKAKSWVDRSYRAREQQEMRRILYVAATRAREELHLFARPAYKQDKGGALSLCVPTRSLLATAWPAVEEEVKARFDEWSSSSGADVASIAAQANVIEFPHMQRAQPRTGMIRRLPADYVPPSVTVERIAAGIAAVPSQKELYERHEGGVRSRLMGIAVHAYLEELSRFHADGSWESGAMALHAVRPRATAMARAAGLPPQEAVHLAEEALQTVLRASKDTIAQWILSPLPEGASEVAWTGILDGTIRTVRVDRIFRAGDEPGSEAGETWWIIDYKTVVSSESPTSESLQKLRAQFAPQLEMYARVLRNLHGVNARVHAGLYYPRMLKFDWWVCSTE